MAIESVEANAGSGGATFATDSITGSVQVPYVKLMSGADAAEDLIGGDATNGLDVDVTRVSGTVTVDGSGVTQPVSAASLPLPTGAATSANQTTIVGHLDGVETLLGTIDTDTGNMATLLGTIDTDTGNIVTAVQLIDDAIHADDAAFTLGTSKGVVIMGFAGTQSVNANDAAALACETDGSLHIHDGGNTITVDGTVTANLAAGTNNIGDVDVLSVVPGTGATNLGKAEDAGHTTGDTGVMALAIRDDTLAAVSGTELDYEPLHTDKDGALWVQPKVSDCLDEALSNTDGASTASTVFGATASNRNYITAISVFRSDAGTSLAYVDFRDGTAGSVIWRMPLPPNGGSVMSSNKPIFKTTANTALAFDVSAALTTVYISLSGFKAP